MESQAHGLQFEEAIIKSITGISKDQYQSLLEGKYTSSMDIVKGIKSKNDYSIKVAKKNTGIGGGDILRFYSHAKQGFTLIIGIWQQKNRETKIYDSIYEFYIKPSDFKTLWGNIPYNVLEDFVKYVKNIPEGKKAQLENRKLWKEKRQKIYDTYEKGLMNIAAKIDSKSQRRVQCSLNIKELIDSGIEYELHTKKYGEISLPYEQKSGSRKFKKS